MILLSKVSLFFSASSQDEDGHRGMRDFQDQEEDVHIFQSGSTFNLTCTIDAFGQVEWLGPHRVEEDDYYQREKVAFYFTLFYFALR